MGFLSSYNSKNSNFKKKVIIHQYSEQRSSRNDWLSPSFLDIWRILNRIAFQICISATFDFEIARKTSEYVGS